MPAKLCYGIAGLGIGTTRGSWGARCMRSRGSKAKIMGKNVRSVSDMKRVAEEHFRFWNYEQ